MFDNAIGCLVPYGIGAIEPVCSLRLCTRKISAANKTDSIRLVATYWLWAYSGPMPQWLAIVLGILAAGALAAGALFAVVLLLSLRLNRRGRPSTGGYSLGGGISGGVAGGGDGGCGSDGGGACH